METGKDSGSLSLDSFCKPALTCFQSGTVKVSACKKQGLTLSIYLFILYLSVCLQVHQTSLQMVVSHHVVARN